VARPGSPKSPSGGYFLVLAGVSLFATVEVAVRDAHVRLSTPPLPLFFTAVRFGVSGLLLLFLSRLRKDDALPSFGRRDMLFTALMGVIAAPVAIGLFQEALTYTAVKASTCAALFSVNPIFVAVLAPFLVGEEVRAGEWEGLFLGLGGAFLMSWSSSPIAGRLSEALLAGGMMLAAAFFFSLYIVMSKPMVQRFGGLRYTGWAFVSGGCTAFLLSLAVEGPPSLQWLGFSRGAADVAWVVFAGTALAYYCYLAGLARVNLAKGSCFFFLKPFLALVFSLLYLGEAFFSRGERWGFLLIMIGLALVLFPRGGRGPSSRLVHETT